MAFSCVTRNVFFIFPLLVLLSTSPLSSSFTSPLSPSLSPSVISPLSPSLSSSETSPLPSSLSPSEKVTKEILYKLCSKPTIYNHFCIAWLTSDPKTYTLNVGGLIGLVLQKTEQFGNKNLAMMKGLERTTTEVNLKYKYGSCVSCYEFSIEEIKSAVEFVFSKEYMSAVQSVIVAVGYIYSCEGYLKGVKNVPDYVYQSNLMFDRMCTIDKVFISALTS